MSSVAILLSTYNGEKYLCEQLDTVLAQSNVVVHVFVRDDGSSDGTVSILERYSAEHENFHFEKGENVGVGNSFMNLLYSVPNTFDYYAFADQDDIWGNEKIFRAVKMLEENENALLYASNQECVDKNGNSMGLRYGAERHINLTPIEIMTCNMLAGCTMVFTKRFYEILSAEKNRPSAELLRNRIHDVWVAMVAAVHNGLIYDNRSFIKYRQHENNVVGATTSLKKGMKERTKKLKNKELRNGRSKLAKAICNKFPEQAEKYPLLELCAKADTHMGKKEILKKQKELRLYSGESYLAFKLKVKLGWF